MELPTEISPELIASFKYYFANYPEGISLQDLIAAGQSARQADAKENLTREFIFVVDQSLTSDPELAGFLDQIINKGLKLNLDDYQIITNDLAVLAMSTKLLVCFGINSLGSLALGHDFPQVRNSIIAGTSSDMLVTDSLSQIKNNPDKKKEFWEVLKRYA